LRIVEITTEPKVTPPATVVAPKKESKYLLRAESPKLIPMKILVRAYASELGSQK